MQNFDNHAEETTTSSIQDTSQEMDNSNSQLTDNESSEPKIILESGAPVEIDHFSQNYNQCGVE